MLFLKIKIELYFISIIILIKMNLINYIILINSKKVYKI